MFHHVAMFKFRDDVSSETIAGIVDRLRGLPGLCPPIRSYRVGSNAGISDDAWDLVVIAGFDNEADWREYADHPEHTPIVEDLSGLVTARARLQTTNL